MQGCGDDPLAFLDLLRPLAPAAAVAPADSAFVPGSSAKALFVVRGRAIGRTHGPVSADARQLPLAVRALPRGATDGRDPDTKSMP